MSYTNYDVSRAPESLQELLSDIEKRSLIVKDGLTPIWEYWNYFIYDYLIVGGRSKATVKNVKDKLRFVLFQVGITSIEEVNDIHTIKWFLGHFNEKRGWSGTTYNSYRKDLNTYFKWLKQLEFIDENKFKKVGKIKEEITEKDCLTNDQVNKLKIFVRESEERTRLEKTRNELFVNILCITGMRTSEAASLNLGSITKEKEGLVLKYKTAKQKGRVQSFYLPEYIEPILNNYLAERKKLGRRGNHLFESLKKGKRWTKSGMQKYFQRLSKTLGFHITVYSIRRYVATYLAHMGADTDDIRKHLGHRKLSTTYTYIQSLPSMTKNTTDILVAALEV